MTYQNILVTGANGLLGANICILAVRHGRRVRGMVRKPQDAAVLERLGVEPVLADITQPEALGAAMHEMQGVIHAAAVIGGTWSTAAPEQFEAANYRGVLNILEAAERTNMGRTLLVSTAVICDPAYTLTEVSPIVPIHSDDSPYTAAKRAAYYFGMHKACRGVNLAFLVPSAMYGPSPFVARALEPTLFTGSLLMALRGKLERYVHFPLTWPYIEDAAAIALAGLDHDGVGERYLAAGRAEDTFSLAEFCNMGCEMAGVRHRVQDVNLGDIGDEIGAIRSLAKMKFAMPRVDPSGTNTALGVALTPLREGLERTLEWLRREGRL